MKCAKEGFAMVERFEMKRTQPSYRARNEAVIESLLLPIEQPALRANLN